MSLLEGEEVNGEPRPALAILKATMSKQWHTVVSAELVDLMLFRLCLEEQIGLSTS